MMNSKRFRVVGVLSTFAAIAGQTAGVGAEVGWTPPAPTAAASTLWLNDAAAASTLGQGMMRLNGPAEAFVLTDPSTVTYTIMTTLNGTVPAVRSGVTAGSLDSSPVPINGSTEWPADTTVGTVVSTVLADVETDVSRVTKTGSAMLLLDDASTYSGASTLSNGSFPVGNTKPFASGAGGLMAGAGAAPDVGGSPSGAFANGAAVGNTVAFGSTLSPAGTGVSSGVDAQGAVQTFTTAANVRFDGVVANGSVVKTGAAALTMTGMNTYAGGTTLTEGTLFAANNAALGTGPLALGSASSPTISSDASGAAATRTFANAVTINGNVTFGDGANNGSMLFASAANLGNSGETRVFTVNSKTTFSGDVGGGAALTKAGSGVLTLSGSNSYSGGTTFASGMLAAGNNASFGSGAMTFAGGSIGSADSTPHTFANSMVFLGNLTVGDYIDSIGALTFTSQVDLGNGDRRITTKSNATFTGAIANGSITKDGLGSLILSGTNTFAGGTTLVEGSLLAGSDQAFGTGVLNLNGGILGSAGGKRSFANSLAMASGVVQFGDAEHLSALSFDGNAALAAGRHTFNTAADTAFNGILAGNGASITKVGDGVLTLANANTYDGGTEIAKGSIRIANDRALGGGVITFSGGALASTGNETRSLYNDVALNGGATLGDGSSTGAFVFHGANNALASGTQTVVTNVPTTFLNGISGAGGLTKSGASTLTLKGDNTYTGDTRVEQGKLVLDGTLHGSKEIFLAAGATLGGHGRFDGTITGYGSVDPGNSPGILTATGVNITSGSVPASGNGAPPNNGSTLSFAFEFTQLGAPTWGQSAASGNDVLLLTGTPAFTAPLNGSNTVNLYFNSSLTSQFTAQSWKIVQGGFFVTDTSSFASNIAGANYVFYFQSGTFTADVQYNNLGYMTEAHARSNGLLPANGQGFVVRTAPVANANFDTNLYPGNVGSGTTSGMTMEIVSVPEPSTWAMGFMAAAGVALARRRRLAGWLSRFRGVPRG